MKIQMIGIDYRKADLDTRAFFALTSKKSERFLSALCMVDSISGAIVLSTCNRFEVWASVSDDCPSLLFEQLMQFKNVKNPEKYQEFFIAQEQQEAISHLFFLTAGLKSQILGEDQILTQIKDALTFSRENGFTDSVLEVLFRMAITAGKRIKSELFVNRGNYSLANELIKKLEKPPFALNDKTCMVIGNGQMGRLIATALAGKTKKVYVTIRAYKHGNVIVPEGCSAISYEERENYLSKCDIVVSATSSPHLTLSIKQIEPCTNPLILVDLAVPRDIDTNCKTLSNICLYNIDDFSESNIKDKEELLLESEKIIQEEMNNFFLWLSGTVYISKIQFIKEEIARDVLLRTQKDIKKIVPNDQDKIQLSNRVELATQNAINKMLYSLKNNLSTENFEKCLRGMASIYE